MRKVLRVELRPNRRQASYIRGCCGLARAAYNWGLHDREQKYAAGEDRPSHFQQCHDWLAHRDANLPWAKQYNASIVLNALKNLDLAFAAFFRRIKLGERPGYPKYKRRHYAGSCQFSGGVVRPQGPDAVRIPFGREAKLPKRLAVVRTKEHMELPEGAVWKTATLAYSATGRFYAAMLYELPDAVVPGPQSVRPLVVHLGIRHFAVLGDDRGFAYVDAPRWRRSALNALREADRQLSRRQRGSSGYEKARLRRAKLYERLTNQRAEFIETFTTRLVRRGRPLVIQQWDVREMYQTPPIARCLVDRPFYEIRRQLEYKAGASGVPLIVIDKSVPVTQRCSRCGYVREGKEKLRLGEPVFTCPKCDLEMCREENACRNLLWAQPARAAGGGVEPALEENSLDDDSAVKPEGSSRC